ncbi:MAG: hypothetical protein JW909_02335 [Planctomycetes bacterium]|nr:hypothetical protein [Planctomycetota bacterium]
MIRRCYLWPLLLLIGASAGAQAAEDPPGDGGKPRIWIEIETSEGAVSHMELVDIEKGCFILKTLEGIKFDLEQNQLTSVKIMGTGDTPPWDRTDPVEVTPDSEKTANEEGSHEPARSLRRPSEVEPLELPVATPRSPDYEERIRRALNSLRPTPGSFIYVASVRKQGKDKEAERYLRLRVNMAQDIETVSANVGILLLLWASQRMQKEQIEKSLNDLLLSIKDNGVRKDANVLLLYIKEHPEVLEDAMRRSSRPGLRLDREDTRQNRFRKPVERDWRQPPR